jgi:hypothetical protein
MRSQRAVNLLKEPRLKHIHSQNHSNHMDSNESIIVMVICMILAGTISGMNSFVNNINDIRLNINDFYMSLMMIGLMFILMSIYYKSMKLFIFGTIVSIITFILLRNQIFVNEYNYIQSMIPHHSMAVMMSKKVLDKKNIYISEDIKSLGKNIIDSQEQEIQIMKNN